MTKNILHDDERPRACCSKSPRVRPGKGIRDLPPYPFSHWNERCRARVEQGIDVVRLDIGNPDLPPPVAVVDAASQAIRSHHNHGYPGYRGTLEFRGAVRGYYGRRFGVSLNADTNIVSLLGSKEGIVHLQHALLDPADVVLAPDPGYAPYAAGARLAGARVVRFPLDSQGAPDLGAISASDARRARLLWLNYPNNPTGHVVESAVLAEAVAFAARHDVLLCHDAAYTDVRFDGCLPSSVLEISGAADVAVEFNSLSKAYNMPGWRIGYAVGNPEALRLLQLVKSNVDSGMFLPLQRAGAIALATDEGWLKRRNSVYQQRLRALASVLTGVGLEVTVPQATHYLWVPIPGPETAEAFAIRLLDETGVAVAPGTFFGPGGRGFIRVSATVPDERLRLAEARLASWRAVS